MEEGARTKVVVIDGSAFARAALKSLIDADPDLEVLAVERPSDQVHTVIRAHNPDVVVLGLGHETQTARELIPRLMAIPRPILVLVPPDLSALDHLLYYELGVAQTLAWEPENNQSRLVAFQSLLVSRINALAASRILDEERADENDDIAEEVEEELGVDDEEPLELAEQAEHIPENARPRNPFSKVGAGTLVQPRRSPQGGFQDPDRRVEVVVLCAGVGGAGVLKQIVRELPSDSQLAVLALTRLPETLVPLFAEHLSRECALKVQIAREGDPLRPGTILVAPPAHNLGLVRTGRMPRALVRMMRAPESQVPLPCMDVTLRACATIYGPLALGLVISGLSSDGREGLSALRARGGLSAVLAPTDSPVSGTNHHCIDAEVIDEVLSLDESIRYLTLMGQT